VQGENRALCSALAALAALAVGGCRERVVLQDGADSAGGWTQVTRPGAGGGDNHPDAGETARAPGAHPATVGQGSERPPVLTCPERRRPAHCELRGDSTHGLRIIGTLLEPWLTRHRGVLDLDAAGDVRCADCDCGEAGEALVIDCPGLVISPGFINLHDHLGYAGTPPLAHPGELYEHRNDWRLGENGHAALPFEGGATAAQVLAQELRMVMAGTTSVVGAGGRRGLLRNLDMTGRSEGLLTGAIHAETFPLDDARGEVDPAACAFGDHADTGATAAAAHAYVPHLGEGTSQRARDELRCALGNLDLLGENSAIVHAMALTRSDVAELARRGASVVWSPRSNLDLYGSTAPVALLRSQGVHVALGTDWLASGSMNQLRELSCAQAYNREVLGGYFNAFELWRMVTANAAWALNLPGRFGALKAGVAGDVAVFAETTDDPYASVIGASPGDVKLVLRQGVPLYGDAELIGAFAGARSCEELDVCGEARRVCSAETGESLGELKSEGEAVYPLFSCATPPDEPHCSAQSSAECPAGEADCAAPPPPPSWEVHDADADGVPDTDDTCPRVADPDQLDRDADGLGDTCDVCPRFNPGLSPCPLSVSELRAPASRLPAGSAVALSSVRVTALRLDGSKGFYVEDGDRAPYSGLFVYTGDARPKVALDEWVDLQGYFDTYQGTDELVDAEVTAHGAASEPYPPLLVAPSELADGAPNAAALASLLVRIENAEVAVSNPDAPKDYDETLLAGGLRLDDLLVTELDNEYPVGTSFASIVGVSGFSFDHQKLYPRSLADIVRDAVSAARRR
jgi:cytosine/adenosine deaminase-related metal-dependent hydrolase